MSGNLINGNGFSSNNDDLGSSVSCRYEHPGHGRIARELQDLRERENEIRCRWKQMGIEVPQVSSENETPFTLQRPIPEMPTSASVDYPLASSESMLHRGSTSPRDQFDGSDAVSISSEASTASSTAVTAAASASTSQQPSANLLPRSAAVKVRPYEDPDDAATAVASTRPAWTPSEETPIQREIRLASEREQLLRQARGLTNGGGSGSGTSAMRKSVTVPSMGSDLNGSGPEWSASSRNGSGAATATTAGNRLSMKNWASARLQLEIEREKQRELDLLRLGCIRSTSDDHIGDVGSTVEELSSRIDRQDSTLSPTDGGGTSPATAESSSRRTSTSSYGRAAAAAGVGGRVSEENGSEVQLRRQRWPLKQSANDDDEVDNGDNPMKRAGLSTRQSAASELIERELRELELRERELRMLRADSNTENGTGSDSNGVHSTTESRYADDRPRSSHQLIGQWEQRTADGH